MRRERFIMTDKSAAEKVVGSVVAGGVAAGAACDWVGWRADPDDGGRDCAGVDRSPRRGDRCGGRGRELCFQAV